MTYIEKEKNLLQKLHETNYQMFDGDKQEALDFIADQLEKFPNYANIVIREQIMTPIWYQKFEGQELRDHIQNMDQQRRSTHETAISAVIILNRISTQLDLDKFADIDTTDRYKVADFIGEYTDELYNNGIGKILDSATYQKKTEYDQTRIKAHILKMEQDLNDIVNNCNDQSKSADHELE